MEIKTKAKETALLASARTGGGAVYEGSKLRLLAAVRLTPVPSVLSERRLQMRRFRRPPATR